MFRKSKFTYNNWERKLCLVVLVVTAVHEGCSYKVYNIYNLQTVVCTGLVLEVVRSTCHVTLRGIME